VRCARALGFLGYRRRTEAKVYVGRGLRYSCTGAVWPSVRADASVRAGKSPVGTGAGMPAARSRACFGAY
jgi:hypothetical protein